jgi:hypothetical protein
MKYFTKYLPVEGEIKMGDKFYEEGLGIGTRTNKKGVYDFQKVKLFLCSRDIQVGDKVIDTDEYNSVLTVVEGDAKTQLGLPDDQVTVLVGRTLGCLKVIGEISSKAYWVKEGDEFQDDQVKLSSYPLCPKCGAFDNSYCPYEDCELDQKRTMAYILGPCGHFH